MRAVQILLIGPGGRWTTSWGRIHKSALTSLALVKTLPVILITVLHMVLSMEACSILCIIITSYGVVWLAALIPRISILMLPTISSIMRLPLTIMRGWLEHWLVSTPTMAG